MDDQLRVYPNQRGGTVLGMVRVDESGRQGIGAGINTAARARWRLTELDRPGRSTVNLPMEQDVDPARQNVRVDH